MASAAMESELIAQFPAPPACYPMELRYIKTLFVRQQYRHCAGACRDVLSKLRSQPTQQPFHDTFVLFYLGICHDELARLMHHNSANKHQSFNIAKSFYLKALESLPSPDEAQAMYMIRAMTTESAQRERSGSSTESEPSAVDAAAREDSSSTSGKPSANSLALCPFLRNDSPMDRTNVITTAPAADSSDDSDLDSHRSFNQIRTPNRNLQRDFSKMSLLDKTPPRQNNAAQPDLLHTVLDSPSKLFDSPESPSSPRQRNTDLPRLDTGSRAGADSSMSGRWSQFSTPEPEDPVSPLGPEDWASEASTISPISPTTPAAEMAPELPVTRAEGEEEDEDDEFHDALDSSQSALRFQSSVEAMRDQIRKHISLVQHAKAQLLLLQAAKKPEFSPKTRAKQAGVHSALPAEDEEDIAGSVAGVYQARIYWSSVSEEIKLAETRRRVEDGRKRNWVRKRFEPERYIDLCEQTLAEL